MSPGASARTTCKSRCSAMAWQYSLLGTGEVTAAGGACCQALLRNLHLHRNRLDAARAARRALSENLYSILLPRWISLTARARPVQGLTSPIQDAPAVDHDPNAAKPWLAKLRTLQSHAYPLDRLYRWVSWLGVDSGVDMFNGSPGQSDPFLNLFIRQPIPTLGSFRLTWRR